MLVLGATEGGGLMTGADCGYEIGCVDGKKSNCSRWQRWTNCREVGYCTMERCGGSTDDDDEVDEDE